MYFIFDLSIVCCAAIIEGTIITEALLVVYTFMIVFMTIDIDKTTGGIGQDESLLGVRTKKRTRDSTQRAERSADGVSRERPAAMNVDRRTKCVDGE